jgi:hypothetical protein
LYKIMSMVSVHNISFELNSIIKIFILECTLVGKSFLIE